MFIEELKRELFGRELHIWQGHDDEGNPLDLPQWKLEAYRRQWRTEAGQSPERLLPERAPCNCGKSNG